MPEVQGLPTVPHDAEHSKSSSIDEKLNEKSDSASVVQSVHGDVYDDIRDIDIGEDGKERPIGMSLFSTSMLHLTTTLRNRCRCRYPSYLPGRRPNTPRVHLPDVVPRSWAFLLRRCSWADLRKSTPIEEYANQC